MYQKVESQYVVRFHGHASELDKGLYYLLLEYCNCDLEKLLRLKKIIPENEAVKIIDQVCRAQHELSTQGIIHRDLKPQNIGLYF